MKSALFLFFVLFSVANAADRNAAYELICKPLPFENDRKSCLAKIRNYKYFDDQALNFCTTLPFNNSKVGCLDLIADKTYERYEMETCLNEVFESKKLECFRTSGTVVTPTTGTCVGRDEVLLQLGSSLRDLRMGNTQEADYKLANLYNRLSACPR